MLGAGEIKETLWRLSKSKFKYFDYYSNMQATFFGDDFRWLISDLKRHTIALDIGAHIGDTTVYLAREPDIDKVFAYEPMEQLYKEAQMNMNLSLYKNKVELVNAAIGDKSRTVHVNSNATEYGGTNLKKIESKRGKEIRYIGINEILKGLKNVVIKIDVEGQEAEILRSANLRNVYKMNVEYHDNLNEVVSILGKNHFQIKVLREQTQNIKQERGHIHAWR